MHVSNLFLFQLLLWVALLSGMTRPSAAQNPQAESHDDISAVARDRVGAEPWETPVDLSLFFAASLEPDVSEYLETAAALLKSGRKEYAVSVLLQTTSMAEEAGAASLAQTAQLLGEAGEGEQAVRLLARSLEMARNSTKNKPSFLEWNEMAAIVPALALADSTEKAIKVAEEIEFAPVRTIALASAATMLVQADRGKEALAILKPTLAAAKEIEEPQAQSEVAELIKEAIGQLSEEETLSSAVELASNLDDAYQKTIALTLVSRGFIRAGNNQRAKAIAEQATTAATEVNAAQRSAARTIIAVVLAEAGDVDGAINLASEIETINGHASALTAIATKIASDDRQRAGTIFSQVAKLAEGIEAASVRASVLGKIGEALDDAGDDIQALSILQQALDVSLELNDGYSKVIMQLGIAARLAESDHMPQARRACEHATSASNSIENPVLRSLALTEIATALAKTNERDRASTALRTASKAAGEIEATRQQIEAFRNIANIALDAGHPQEARATLDLAAAAGEKITGEDREQILLGVAIDLARAAGSKEAIQAIRTTTDPESRVMSLDLIASALIAAGNREQSLAVLAQAVDEAANIKGERSYKAALLQIAKSLTRDFERTGDGFVSGELRLSFTPKEREFAKRLVEATSRKNEFMANLQVVVLSTPKITSREFAGVRKTYSLQPDKQNGLLRLEQRGETLVLSGFVRGLMQGDHEILIQSGVATERTQHRSHYSSLLVAPQAKATDKNESATGQIELGPRTSVDVESLGRFRVDADGTAKIQLTLSGKSQRDLFGRAILIRSSDREESNKKPSEVSRTILSWGFVIKPVDDLVITDQNLWNRVFPDFSAYDLPEDEYVRAMIQGLKVRNSVASKRPETLNSAASAIELDGHSGYLSTPLRHDGKQPITLEAWVKPNDLTGHREVICNAQSAGMVLGFYDGTCKFLVHDGSRYREVSSQLPVKVNRTIHIAGVFDGNRMTLFVNGRKQGRGALLAGSVKPSSMPFLIGANPERNKPPIKYFSGLIDEVRISHSARYHTDFVPQRFLSSDEDAIAVYHFDEESGVVAKDSSKNGFDATVHDARWVVPSTTKQKSFVLPSVAETSWDTPASLSLYMAKNHGDEESSARALARVASQIDAVGDNKRSLEALKQAVEASSRVEDPSRKCEVTAEVARALIESGSKESAMSILRRSADVAQQIEDASRQTTALLTIGSVISKAGEEQQAAAVTAKALESAEQIENARSKAASLSRGATLFHQSGDNDVALMLLEKAAGAAQRIEDVQRKKTELWRIVAAIAESGDHKTAVELGRETDALSAEHAVNAPASRSSTLAAQSAIRAMHARNLQTSRQTALRSIAVAFAGVGDFDRSNEMFRQAIESAESFADENSRSLSLSRIASAKATIVMDLVEKGEFQQALELTDSIEHSWTRVSTLINVAQSLDKAGENDRAVTVLTQAANASDEIAVARLRADARSSIASELAAKGSEEPAAVLREEAIQSARESLDAIQKIQNPSSRQRYLELIARTLSNVGEKEQAVAALKRSVEATSELPARSRTFALVRIAKTMANIGEPREALTTLDLAFKDAQNLEWPSRYSREFLRANAMFTIAGALCEKSDEQQASPTASRLKTEFADAELDLAKRLAQDAARAARISTARKRLRSGPDQRLLEDDDPEIAWLAGITDFSRRAMFLHRADRIDLQSMVDDLKSLVGDRKFDQDAHSAANHLAQSIARTEHKDILASLYEYMGTKMNESTNNYYRSQAERTLSMARRIRRELLGDPSATPKERDAIATIRFAPVKQFDISPDGQRIAAVSEETDKVGVWNARSGKQLHALDGHTGGVSAMAFAPDGKWIASGGVDGIAIIWDAKSGEEVLRLEAHPQHVRGVSFSPDGNWLATSGRDDQTVKLWNTTTGEMSRSFKHPGYVANVVFSPDGTRIVAGGRNRPFSDDDGPRVQFPGACVVKVWSLATGEETASLEGTGWAANLTRFSPDGRLVASACVGKARVWDASSGRELFTTNHRVHFGASVFSVSFTPDSRRLVTAGSNQEAVVWDTSTGEELFALQHSDRLSGATFSHDGRWLATGTTKGKVTLWDITSRKRYLAQEANLGRSLVRFSSDDSLLVSIGTQDGLIKVWDVRDIASKPDEGSSANVRRAELDKGSGNRSNPFARLQTSATNLGDLYSRQGKLDQAIQWYRKAIEIGRGYAPAHVGLGNVFNKQGKLDEALKEFRTAIKLDPNLPIAHNNLAWALVTHPDEDGSYQDLPEAIASAKRACELDHGNYAYLNTLGVAMYRNGDWKEAIDELQGSVDTGADIPHNWLFIAMSQWQLGNKEQARALYNKSITWREKNKADDEVKAFFAEAERLLGNADPVETPSRN